MAQITTELIKQLREKTGVGMLDCRAALVEANGDLEKAVELLRKKGAAVAAKRAENVTNHGVVAAYVAPDHRTGALVELSCETDFAANTEVMQTFIKNLAEHVAQNPDTQNLMTQPMFPAKKLSVKETLEELLSKISENIKIGKIARFAVPGKGLVNAYIHPGATLGILVEIDSDKDFGAHAEAVAQLAKDICMQIAVNKPLCVAPTELDPTLVEKEKAIIKEQLIASGKPTQMIEKIMQGKLDRFYEDVCLMYQKFIKNDKLSIAQHVEAIGKQIGCQLKIVKFARFAIGK